MFNFSITQSNSVMGLQIITPDSYIENRGEIWTSYLSEEFDKLVSFKFIHDKFSVSKNNVLRGIHGDEKSWKLISCPMGDITAVMVDMRPSSKTYLKHEKFRLNSKNRLHILIPPGVGNSFYVHSNEALYHYKLAYEGDYIDEHNQFTIAWNDPKLSIDWPCTMPILSNRDAEI